MQKNLKTKISTVDDEIKSSQKIKKYLQKNNYVLQITGIGIEIFKIIQKSEPGLIILDWLLSNKFDIKICVQIGNCSNIFNIPITMLPSRKKDLKKIIAPDNEIDNYLINPFNTSELITKIKALKKNAAYVF